MKKLQWFFLIIFLLMIAITLFYKEPFNQKNTNWIIEEYNDGKCHYPFDIDNDSNYYFTHGATLQLKRSKIIITLNYPKEQYYGKYKSFEKNDSNYIELYNFKNEKLNGIYELDFNQFMESNNLKSYELILKSNTVYIQAKRSDFKLNF
ncbi:hypothetical protein [Winogradskyella jejuensis]|nr:hypothetical protein [Winogradskyella jejuensis]